MIAPPNLKRARSGTTVLQRGETVLLPRTAATLPPLPQHQSPREPQSAPEPNAIKDAILRYLEALP